MQLGRWFFRTFSLSFWGKLPARFQRALSRVYASIYDRSLSRHLIAPYCRLVGMNKEYLSKFRPASGSENYRSFQDFFTRKFKEGPKPESSRAWPCEGRICDRGRIGAMQGTRVKGHYRYPRTIFSPLDQEIPDGHYFVNIFLHNNDYHRLHSPIDGKVERVEHVEGDLVVLRPWIYPEDPSIPAFRNERVNLMMREKGSEELWFLSIIGGPAVGGIRLEEKVEQKGELVVGEELGTFLLGSTLCMAAPIEESIQKDQYRVSPGVSIGDG